jgi:hypothetical protein
MKFLEGRELTKELKKNGQEEGRAADGSLLLGQRRVEVIESQSETPRP